MMNRKSDMVNEWICDCGAKNTIKYRYCPRCGHEIPNTILDRIIKDETKEAVASLGLNEEIVDFIEPRSKKECPQCKRKNPLSTQYCKSCGCKLPLIEHIQPKSKVAASILAILFGWLGLHNFYLKNYKKAIVQFAVFTLFYLTHAVLFSILFVTVTIWAIVEGFLLLAGVIKTDGDGILLS